MSSPFIPPNNGYPGRAAASSPGPGGRGREVSHAPEDVAIRPMRLKVLYTFDDQNKTNCLARWPQVLDIRTAYLDESTQVGIIELKTCIQAIVSASPELVAKLGQDYTVYAYDYSEYETPLVGQGMLSWVLASSSSTPSAPAHQSRTVVTGRVCKNLLGLFSSGVQETLEVKLRLVPVPTCLQSEYIESMRQYRDLSKIIPEGFDVGAWTAFLQANPGITQLADQSRSQTPADGMAQREGVGIEHVQRMMSRDYASSRTEDQRPFQRSNSYSATGPGEQIARIASPAYSFQSAGGMQERLPRTSSGGSHRGIQEGNHDRRTSVDTGSVTNDERFEEGPAKKRAKVMKADWPGKGSFGKQPESLRVAASTAASIRVYQPTAIRPSANTTASLEEPPRAPTPIPGLTNQMKRPLLPAAKSSLGRESYSNVAESYISPYATSELNLKLPESAMTSPENSHIGSVSNTPAHIASSPPELRRGSPTPSSPRLPTWPRDVDSGFMSGTIDDLFEEDDEDRPIDEEDVAIAAQYSKREQSSTTQTAKRRPTQERATDHVTVEESQTEAKAETAKARSRTAARNASRVRSLNRTASSGTAVTSSVPASDPIRPNAGSMQRSQTWSGTQMPHAASDAPMSTIEGPARPRSRGSGSGVRRKQAIQSKLATSIASGEMPPFCENCGAIETPTWRKAWTKIHSGTPDHVRLSDEEGGVILWEPLQKDENGAINLFRIFKKSLKDTDEGFKEILLCNPCGLWLHNRRCMRPKDVYEKTQRRQEEKRNGGPGSKRQRKKSSNDQSTTEASNGFTMQSDASSPMDAPENDPQEPGGAYSPQLPPIGRPRASSAQAITRSASKRMDESAAAVALQRAIQSSPARFLGTQHVPIEVEDLTPKPTRRMLFPSPRKAGQEKALDEPCTLRGGENQQASPEASTKHLNPTDPFETDDKENQPPPPLPAAAAAAAASSDDTDQDDLSHLFEDRPTTNPNFKTPTRILSTNEFFSSAAKALLLHPPQTPKRTPSKHAQSPSPSHPHLLPHQPLAELSPFTAQLNHLLSEAHNASPGAGGLIDFPVLSELGDDGAGLMEQQPGREWRFGDGFAGGFGGVDVDGFFGGDGVMPSSPPGMGVGGVGWGFGVYEDPIEGEGEGEGGGVGWGDYHVEGGEGGGVEEAVAEKVEKVGVGQGIIGDQMLGQGVGEKVVMGLRVDGNGRAVVDFGGLAAG